MPSRNASIYIRRSTVQHLLTNASWWDTIAITIEDSTLSTSHGSVDANGCHDIECIGAWGALSIVSNVALTIRRCLFLPQVQASALPLCHYGIFSFLISQRLENSVFLIEDCNLTFGMMNISSTAVSAWVCSLAVNLRRLLVAVSNVTSLLEVVGPSPSQEMARSTAAVSSARALQLEATSQ